MPPTEILIILVSINFLGLLFVISLYYILKDRIKSSLQGPSSEVSIEIPQYLKMNLRILFTGLALISFTNLISHLSALLFPQKNAYLLVGDKDFFLHIALILIVTGIILLNRTINLVNKQIANNFEYNLPLKHYFSLLLFILLPELLLIIYHLKYRIIVIGFFGLLGILFLYIMRILIETYRNPSSNRILWIRKIIVLTLPLYLIIYIFLIVGLFKTTNSDPPIWSIENSTVEFYFLIGDIFVLILTINIFLILIFPRWLRKLFKISDEYYYQHRDIRFDYEWTNVEWVSEIGSHFSSFDFSAGYEEYKDILLVNNYDSIFVKHEMEKLKLVFKTNKLINQSTFLEDYVQNHEIIQNHTLIISPRINEAIQPLVKTLENAFGYKVEINDYITLNDEFIFKSPNYEYVFLAILPSLRNINKRTWLILAKEKIFRNLVIFLKDYHTYLEEISYHKTLITILRFPKEGENIFNIPPIFPKSGIPDQRYVIVL